MVAGEEDQGVVVFTAGLEMRHDAPDRVIHLVHHAEITGAHLAQLKLRHVDQIVRIVFVVFVGAAQVRDPLLQVRMLGGLLVGRSLALWQLDRSRVIQGVVGLGRDDRRMRTQENAMHEPVLRAMVPEPFDDRVGHETGVAVLGLEQRRNIAMAATGRNRKPRLGLVNVLPSSESVTLGAQVVHPGCHVVGEQHADSVTRQRAFEGAQRRVLRVQAARVGTGIRVTKQNRVVTVAAHFQRDVGMAPVQRRSVAPGAVVHQVQTGLHARARRPARRGNRKMPFKQYAVRRQRVQMRGLHDRMTQRREALATPLVRRNEENLARRCHLPVCESPP